MATPIVPPAQLQPDVTTLIWGQNDFSDGPLSEAKEQKYEPEDEIFFKPKDAARLTSEERQVLLSHGVKQEEWERCGYDYASTHPSSMIHEEREKSSDEILVEEAEALGKQFGPNGSVLAPEQRKALYKHYLSMHLKDYGLQSPQYYPYFEELSEPLSVEECMWPGAVGYEKANRLKRGYIDPHDLTTKLNKLKPSNNFELRKPTWPRIEWTKSPVYECSYTKDPHEPDMFYHQRWTLTCHENIRHLRRSKEDLEAEIKEPWDEAMRNLDLPPTPDLHLLRNIGRSPGGTLFPRYLIQGLHKLRQEADITGSRCYDEEYKTAKSQKVEAIDRWKETTDTALQYFPIVVLPFDCPAELQTELLRIPRYRVWPVELMEELREIDREAVRRGRRRYMDLLRQTEEKMQKLVMFWNNCGAITGQRSPPLSWWLAPLWAAHRSESFLWPPRLVERLDTINAETKYPDGAKEILIEMSRWKEALLNTGSEPVSPGTPFPQSLSDELDLVWRNSERYESERTEDAMIAKMGLWRKAKREDTQQYGATPQVDMADKSARRKKISAEGRSPLSQIQPSKVFKPSKMKRRTLHQNFNNTHYRRLPPEDLVDNKGQEEVQANPQAILRPAFSQGRNKPTGDSALRPIGSGVFKNPPKKRNLRPRNQDRPCQSNSVIAPSYNVSLMSNSEKKPRSRQEGTLLHPGHPYKVSKPPRQRRKGKEPDHSEVKSQSLSQLQGTRSQKSPGQATRRYGT